MKNLLLTMLGVLLALPSLASEYFTYEYEGQTLKYGISSETDKTVSVVDNKNISGDLKIPTVAVFEDVEYSVIYIGYYAFSSCKGLTSVEIPNSVTSIGGYAFSGCSSLTSITIPNSVTEIGEYSFSQCSGLTSIEIPSSITSISDWAFDLCTGLTEVTIPNTVTKIGSRAFTSCTGMTSVTIGNSVESIGDSAFTGCDSLETVYFNAEDCQKCGVKYIVFPKTLKEVVIGDKVKRIPPNAFNSCSGLTSLTIGNSLTSIGGGAFEGCNAIETLYFNAEDCKSLSAISSANLKEVYIADKVKRIPDYAFTGGQNLTEMTIPHSVTSIGTRAFYNCSGLTEMTIPSSVTSIGNEVFYGCTSLSQITVEEGNENYCSIDGVLFNKEAIEIICFPCGKSGEYTIPDSVSEIPSFAYSSRLTSIIIPNSITKIAWNAFVGCNAIETVFYNTEAPYEINESTFPMSVYENATLYIPGGCLDTFKESSWKLFQNIKEFYVPVAKVGETTLSTDTTLESDEAVEVALTCETDGAEIYYLLTPAHAAESTAEAEYTRYTEPVKVEASSALSVYAKLNELKSEISTYNVKIYVIPAEPVAKVGETVLSTEAAFESDEAVEVALTCETEGAEIYYLLTPANAAEPTAEAEYTRYTEPVKVETTAKLSVYALNSRGLKSEVKTYDIDIKTNMVSMTMADLEDAEVYTLQGMRVVRPEAGQIYIVRKGGRAYKTIVK